MINRTNISCSLSILKTALFGAIMVLRCELKSAHFRLSTGTRGYFQVRFVFLAVLSLASSSIVVVTSSG